MFKHCSAWNVVYKLAKILWKGLPKRVIASYAKTYYIP